MSWQCTLIDVASSYRTGQAWPCNWAGPGRVPRGHFMNGREGKLVATVCPLLANKQSMRAV